MLGGFTLHPPAVIFSKECCSQPAPGKNKPARFIALYLLTSIDKLVRSSERLLTLTSSLGVVPHNTYVSQRANKKLNFKTVVKSELVSAETPADSDSFALF